MLFSYAISKRHESTTVNKDSTRLWCPGSPHESSTIILDLQDSAWSSAVWKLDMYLLKLTLINAHRFLTGFNFSRKMVSTAATIPLSLEESRGLMVSRCSRCLVLQFVFIWAPGCLQCKVFHLTFPILLLGSEYFNLLLFHSFQSISG